MEKPVFKRKVEEVLAIQWNGDNFKSIKDFYYDAKLKDKSTLIIPNLFDKSIVEEASLGDWIMFSDLTKKFSVISNDAFEKYYI